jgi:hypothetical protein
MLAMAAVARRYLDADAGMARAGIAVERVNEVEAFRCRTP